ncbi:serine/arginine repetitive matrix protein 2-like isoform X2 [Oncorhynchus keta]|uniref:serine/arginine repetitive matrix protein 2-like isoform X2 n=1 Tax=Oncorhynchus keta TaxID=8018 RepID=UPI00227A48A4|nr:serine/arginine repetitive matrix protein 2-like isoform X2 [Oncorhynchus keta]
MTDGQYKASISNNARLTGKEDEDERKRKKVATTTTGRRLEKAKAKIREGDETWKPHSNRKRIRVRRKEGLEPEQGQRTETPKAKTERRQEDETWSQHRKRIRVRRKEGLEPEQGRRTETPKAKTERRQEDETWSQHRKRIRVRRTEGLKAEQEQSEDSETPEPPRKKRKRNVSTKIEDSPLVRTERVKLNDRTKTENGQVKISLCSVSLSTNNVLARERLGRYLSNTSTKSLSSLGEEANPPPEESETGNPVRVLRARDRDVKRPPNVWSATGSCSPVKLHQEDKQSNMSSETPSPSFSGFQALAKAVGLLQIPPTPPPKRKRGRPPCKKPSGKKLVSQAGGLFPTSAMTTGIHDAEAVEHKKERGEGEPQGKERAEPRGKERGGEGEPQGKERGGGEPQGKKGGEPQRKKRGELQRKKREGEPHRTKREGEPHRTKREGEPQRKKNGREPQGKEKGGGEPQGKEKGGGEPQGKEKGGGEPQGKEKGGGEPQGKEKGGGEPQGKEKGGGEPQGKEKGGGEPQGKEKGGGEPQGKEKGGGDPQVKENRGGEPQGKDDKRKCRKRVRLREGHGKGERAELFQRLPVLSKSKTVVLKPSSQTTSPSTHEEQVPSNCSGIGTGTILQPQPSGQPQNSSPKRSGETESDRDPLRHPAVKRTPSKGRAPTVCLKKFQELLKHRHQNTRKSTKSKQTKESETEGQKQSERKLLKPNESDNGQNESRLMNKNISSSQSLERKSAIRPTVDNDHQTNRTESDHPEEKDGGHNSSTCGQETEYQDLIYKETERENVEDREHFENTGNVLDGKNVDASGDFFKLREELATLSMTRTKDMVDPHRSDKGNKEGRDLVSKENRERDTDSSTETNQKTEKGKGSVVEAYRSVIIQEVEEKMEDGYLEMEISSEELDVVDEVQQTLGYAGAEEVSGEEEEIDVEEMGPTMYPDAAWQEGPGAREGDQVSSTMASFRGITHIHLPQKIKMETAAPEMADVSIPTPLEAEPFTLTSRRVTTGSTGSWEPEEEEDVEVDVLEWSPDVRPRVWGAGLEQGVTELTEEDEIDVMGEETD